MKRRHGQAMLESMLMVFVLSLLACGLYQLALVFAAKDVLLHSARSAARAKTVGLNHWMVEKCARIAAIPNAGLLTVPGRAEIQPPPVPDLDLSLSPGALWDDVLGRFPVSRQVDTEMAKFEDYLGSDYPLQAHYILDYADWHTISVKIPDPTPGPAPSLVTPIMHATVSQDFAMRVPMHKAFWASDTIQLEGECYMETHYDLYIQDNDW